MTMTNPNYHLIFHGTEKMNTKEFMLLTGRLPENYDHEIECKGNTNCTCNEIIDAKYTAEEDSKWNS